MAPKIHTYPTGESVEEYNVLNGYTYRLGYIYPHKAKTVAVQNPENYEQRDLDYWQELNRSTKYYRCGIATDSLIVNGNRVSVLNVYTKYEEPLSKIVKWFDGDIIENYKKIHHIATLVKSYLMKDLCDIMQAIEKSHAEEHKRETNANATNDWMYFCNEQWNRQYERKELVRDYIELHVLLKFVDDMHSFAMAKITLTRNTKLPEEVIRDVIMPLLMKA